MDEWKRKLVRYPNVSSGWWNKWVTFRDDLTICEICITEGDEVGAPKKWKYYIFLQININIRVDI